MGGKKTKRLFIYKLFVHCYFFHIMSQFDDGLLIVSKIKLNWIEFYSIKLNSIESFIYKCMWPCKEVSGIHIKTSYAHVIPFDSHIQSRTAKIVLIVMNLYIKYKSKGMKTLHVILLKSSDCTLICRATIMIVMVVGEGSGSGNSVCVLQLDKNRSLVWRCKLSGSWSEPDKLRWYLLL